MGLIMVHYKLQYANHVYSVNGLYCYSKNYSV